jgi:hypothetical protein
MHICVQQPLMHSNAELWLAPCVFSTVTFERPSTEIRDRVGPWDLTVAFVSISVIARVPLLFRGKKQKEMSRVCPSFDLKVQLHGLAIKLLANDAVTPRSI